IKKRAISVTVWILPPRENDISLLLPISIVLGIGVRKRERWMGEKGGKWVEMPRSGDGMVGIYRRGEKIGEGIGE
ncbi:hypothetical protein Csa_004036, partial [Cucumis sativus]